MIMWVLWAINLLIQNITFTLVSRARNSGSLKRHVLAAIGSNGVFIIQFQLMLGPFMDYMNGKHGLLAQCAVAVYYTIFTVAGSVLAHYWALKTEKGKSAVGANSRYAQIPVEEWKALKDQVSDTHVSFNGETVFLTVDGKVLTFKNGLLIRQVERSAA
jgi:hypothetical protein